jgi:acyl carrier protein
MTTEARLKEAFTKALGVQPTARFEDLKYRVLPEWDSIAHMQLVMEIENAFDIMLATEDVIDLSSYLKAKEILTKYGITVTT